MTGRVVEMRDLVNVNVTGDLPIRSRALPFADRVEIRFGKAFPVALLIDGPALERLADAIEQGRTELAAATQDTQGTEGLR